MNKKYTYRCNDSGETDYIITDGVYDFEDWLRDSISGNYSVEVDGNFYYILDGCNEHTGEVYHVISVENTSEELCY